MAMMKTIDGIPQRSNAPILVGDRDIHRAAQAQRNGVNMKGIIILWLTGEGIRSTMRVMAAYAATSPPKIAQRPLNRPILLPSFSGVERV
jgi:hypothetical protein